MYGIPAAMSVKPNAAIEQFMAEVKENNPWQTEFHQAVEEVVESVMPLVLERKDFRDAKILMRMTEPDRIMSFRVAWENDAQQVCVNRGYRVQFNCVLGPYKGGLRFHPSVDVSVLKFLGFEQTFKNSLTGLPMGGGKGGANFDPKGKSDREVMRFCQAFMTELHRHIGADIDVPAGDIGVGAREIGFLFGQYKRLENRHEGTITGKGLHYGGSQIRTEATGYGAVYFCENMLNHISDGLERKRCVVSGSGNVALYTIEKLIDLGALPITFSDSSGFVHDPDGINREKLAWLKDLKENRRGRVSEYAEHYRGATFHEGKRPWGVHAQVAFPSATQNEIDLEAANVMMGNGLLAVVEGANMPTQREAVEAFHEAKIMFAPAKAANAGGVAVSGLEQSQNSQRLSWDREKVNRKLHEIMRRLHGQCVEHGQTKDGGVDYVQGANIAGFLKVAEAMLSYGIY